MPRIVVGRYEVEVTETSQSGNQPPLSGLNVYHNNDLIKSVPVFEDADVIGLSERSIIAEDNRIVVFFSNYVFAVAIPEVKLLWKTQADGASCLQIFSYQNDYLIHGELDITRLSHNGDIVWQQGGADIFVTPNGSDNFLITDTYIEATDWDFSKYRFDFDGKVLSYERSTNPSS